MPPLCAVDWCIAVTKHGSKYCPAHALNPDFEPKGRHGRERADANDGDLDFDDDADAEDDDDLDEDEDDEDFDDEDDEDFDESDLAEDEDE